VKLELLDRRDGENESFLNHEVARECCEMDVVGLGGS